MSFEGRYLISCHFIYRYPDQRGHQPPPPPSQPRLGSHRSTSPDGSRHSADHDPRARAEFMDRRMPNGDVQSNYRDSRYPQDGPNDYSRQHYPGPHDGNHPHAYQANRHLEQLSISTSQAPRVSSAAAFVCLRFVADTCSACTACNNWLLFMLAGYVLLQGFSSLVLSA